ncbi:MAG: hypothetical protein JWL73_619 [Actinomycetia bacterium]|nr:hypothetical protein [Actinomycetes bacterium]
MKLGRAGTSSGRNGMARLRVRTRAAGLAIATVACLAGFGLAAGPASAAVVTGSGCTTANALTSYTFTMTHLDGTTTTSSTLNGARSGDSIVVSFNVAPGCTAQLGFASYRSPNASYNTQQTAFSSSTGTFTEGTHTLSIVAPPTTVGPNCPNPNDSTPNFSGNGANQSGAYNSTCDGSASQNGNGNGNSNKPCAGCVGNADNKNPPGQAPNGLDHNAGYECDRNQGVGQSNPAHSGCTQFQLDFVWGAPITSGPPNYGVNVIAFTFA